MQVMYKLTVQRKDNAEKVCVIGYADGSVLETIPGRAFRQARKSLKNAKATIYNWEVMTLELIRDGEIVPAGRKADG